MGANSFAITAKAKTAGDAFNAAVSQAKHDYGHAGYTGTIAEKRSFTIIPVPAGRDAGEYARELFDNDDPRIADKWGPAGCVQLAADEWLFFGLASS